VSKEEDAKLAQDDARLLRSLATELETYSRCLRLSADRDMGGNEIVIRNLARVVIRELSNRIV
jgi:hypothetical protein